MRGDVLGPKNKQPPEKAAEALGEKVCWSKNTVKKETGEGELIRAGSSRVNPSKLPETRKNVSKE